VLELVLRDPKTGSTLTAVYIDPSNPIVVWDFASPIATATSIIFGISVSVRAAEVVIEVYPDYEDDLC